MTPGLVAAGSLEGTVTNVETNPWDDIAGVHLVRQAGDRVTGLDGERWTHDARGLVASNGRIHDEMLAAAREIDGDSRTTVDRRPQIATPSLRHVDVRKSGDDRSRRPLRRCPQPVQARRRRRWGGA